MLIFFFFFLWAGGLSGRRIKNAVYMPQYFNSVIMGGHRCVGGKHRRSYWIVCTTINCKEKTRFHHWCCRLTSKFLLAWGLCALVSPELPAEIWQRAGTWIRRHVEMTEYINRDFAFVSRLGIIHSSSPEFCQAFIMPGTGPVPGTGCSSLWPQAEWDPDSQETKAACKQL